VSGPPVVPAVGRPDVLELLPGLPGQQQTLARFVLHLTEGDRPRAELVVRETIRCAGSPAPGIGHEQPPWLRPWLVSAARRVASDPQRDGVVRPAAAAAVATSRIPVPGSERPALVVVDALRTLTHPHRQILVETHFRGHTVTAAAARLGLPLGTAKSRIHSAMCALRRMLEPQLPATARAHAAVGAYALGLLDPDEMSAFEDHLVGCRGCTDELDSLVPVVARLAAVGPPAVADREPVAGPGQDDGASSRHSRRRPSLPQLLLTGTAMVSLLAIGGGFPKGAATPDRQGPAGRPPGPGQQVSVTDPTTRVHAEFELDEQPGGTQVDFSVANLGGPADCRLVAVGPGGRTRVVSTWHVPDARTGAGSPAAPVRLHASTQLPRAAIDRFVVQAVAADGVATSLVIARLTPHP
jgi:RNA polymerase sigma-70 factor, ECF subfamily